MKPLIAQGALGFENIRTRFCRATCVVHPAWFALVAGLLVILPNTISVAQQLNIIVANPIKVRPSTLAPLAIGLSPTEALPDYSFLRLRGLPNGTKLTQGYRVSDTTWAVPITGLSNLSLQLPPTMRGSQTVDIQVVGVDGSIHAQREINIVVTSNESPLSRPEQPNAPQADQSKSRQSKRTDTIASAQDRPGSQEPQSRTIRRTQTWVPPSVESSLLDNKIQNSTNQSDQSTKPSSSSVASESEDAAFRAEKLFQRGNAFLLDGNLNAARRFYRRSADLGLASAAIALASTYDPAELEKLGIRDIPPEPEQARRWYNRAIALGATQIQQRLERLPNP